MPLIVAGFIITPVLLVVIVTLLAAGVDLGPRGWVRLLGVSMVVNLWLCLGIILEAKKHGRK